MKISIPSKINTKFTYDNTRYYTTLNGSSDFFEVPTVSLTGAFEIEFNNSTTYSGGLAQMILGDSVSVLGYVAIITGVGYEVKINGSLKTFNSANTEDGKINFIRVVRDGSDNLTVFENGVSLGTQTLTGSLVLDLIGNWFSGTYDFNGVISDVKITDAGTLIRDYPIDEDWSDPNNMVLRNRATTLGADQVTDGDFSSVGDWIEGVGWTISGGNANGVVTSSNLVQDVEALAITDYLVEITLSSYTSGTLGSDVGGTSINNISALGTFSDVVTTVNTNDLRFYGGGITCSIDNVIVRQADGYGTFNGSSANAELFTSVADGWVGAELVTNGTFATDTDWTKAAGWTISSGLATCDGTNNAKLYQDIGLLGGLRYLAITNIPSLTSGLLDLRYHNGVYVAIKVSLGVGRDETIFNTIGTPDGFIYLDSDSYLGNVNSFSCKRILEAP